jgi:hypothetical protein
VLKAGDGGLRALQDHQGQPAGASTRRAAGAAARVRTILGQEDFAAYLAGLRQRYKIDINKAALERKER